MLKFAISSPVDDRPSKFVYFIRAISKCTERVSLLDWFSARERLVLNIPSNIQSNYVTVTGDKSNIRVLLERRVVFVPKSKTSEDDNLDFTTATPSEDYCCYGLLSIDETNILAIRVSDNGVKPPFRMWEQFQIRSGDIVNFTDKETKTDVGKFFLNQLLWVDPFGAKVPYMNKRFNPSACDAIVAKMILNKQITRSEYNTYVNNGYWYCEDSTLCMTTWSEKSMVTDPRIGPLKWKKFEELKQQGKLDPTSVSKLESELISMDKDWLKDDPSEAFYIASGSDAFAEQRKKIYITFGAGQDFDKDNTKTVCAPESLADGWRIKNIDIAANDIRRGSYGRGKETAKGGEATKFVLRIFQEVAINTDDCHTNQGISVFMDDTQIKRFDNRWTTDGILINADNKNLLLGKTVMIRSPMFCKAQGGFCDKCCGELFKSLDIKQIGLQALSTVSAFTSVAMKAMHSSSLHTTNLKNFSRFLR